jgi:hypothetical protein
VQVRRDVWRFRFPSARAPVCLFARFFTLPGVFRSGCPLSMWGVADIPRRGSQPFADILVVFRFLFMNYQFM